MYILDRLLLSNVDFSLAHIITKEGLSGFIIMGYALILLLFLNVIFICEPGFFNLPF